MTHETGLVRRPAGARNWMLFFAVPAVLVAGCQQRLVDVPANDPNAPVVTWKVENLTTGKVTREGGPLVHALGDIRDTLRVTVTASNPGGVRDLKVTGWGQPQCTNADNVEDPKPVRTDLPEVSKSSGAENRRALPELVAVYEFSVARGGGPAGQPGVRLPCPEGRLKKKGESYGLVCTTGNFSGKQTVSKLQLNLIH